MVSRARKSEKSLNSLFNFALTWSANNGRVDIIINYRDARLQLFTAPTIKDLMETSDKQSLTYQRAHSAKQTVFY